MPAPPLSLLVVTLLVLVHLFAQRIRLLSRTPRSRWLSAAGAVPITFVFLQILPTLASDQRLIIQHARETTTIVKNPMYLVALLGLVIFYGVEETVRSSRSRQRHTEGKEVPGRAAFWSSIMSFATINAVIGYLLTQGPGSLRHLVPFSLAMALKFTVDDHGLRANYQQAYDRLGRWIVAAAVPVGWAVGAVTVVPEIGLAILRAFLAGGILFNVLKEELPQRESRCFWPFTAGAVAYAGLLLTL